MIESLFPEYFNEKREAAFRVLSFCLRGLPDSIYAREELSKKGRINGRDYSPVVSGGKVYSRWALEHLLMLSKIDDTWDELLPFGSELHDQSKLEELVSSNGYHQNI